MLFKIHLKRTKRPKKKSLQRKRKLVKKILLWKINAVQIMKRMTVSWINLKSLRKIKV